jgi:hypothetical protein
MADLKTEFLYEVSADGETPRERGKKWSIR